MKKSTKADRLKSQDPLAPRPDLDFSKGKRGEYTNLLAKGTNLAIIDPALHPFFPDSESVNQALRALLDIQERLKLAAPAKAA